MVCCRSRGMDSYTEPSPLFSAATLATACAHRSSSTLMRNNSLSTPPLLAYAANSAIHPARQMCMVMSNMGQWNECPHLSRCIGQLNSGQRALQGVL